MTDSLQVGSSLQDFRRELGLADQGDWVFQMLWVRSPSQETGDRSSLFPLHAETRVADGDGVAKGHIKENLHKKWHLMTSDERYVMWTSIEELAKSKKQLKALLDPEKESIKADSKVQTALEKLIRKASKQVSGSHEAVLRSN